MPPKRDLILAPETSEVVRTLHPTTKHKVREAIESIRDNPEIGEELRRELSGLRRLRVARLRIVYRVARRQIQIVAIGPRATIYLDLAARQRDASPDSTQ